MSSDAAHFLDSVRLRPHQQLTLVHPLLQAELPRIIPQAGSDALPNGCLLADIGDFLLDVVDILSELADVVVNGKHIREHNRNRMSQLEQEPDLHTTDYLDDKHAALRDICSQLRTSATDIRNIWESSPPVPSSLSKAPAPVTSLPIRKLSSAPIDRGHTRMASQNSTVSGSGGSWASPDAEGSDWQARRYSDQGEGSYQNEDNSALPLVEQLKARGTGTYTCHLGTSCRKGGVNPDGSIKVFSRNSEFRAHVLRHEKLFKCDLPGCPNNGKGFARPDQLERHKLKVKHSTGY